MVELKWDKDQPSSLFAKATAMPASKHYNVKFLSEEESLKLLVTEPLIIGQLLLLMMKISNLELHLNSG